MEGKKTWTENELGAYREWLMRQAFLEKFFADNPDYLKNMRDLGIVISTIKLVEQNEQLSLSELDKRNEHLARAWALPRPGVIIKPPGAQLMRFVRFFFSKEALAEVFVPAYNDFWHEYAEAKVKGEDGKARWIRLRYYWAFAKTSGILKAFEWAWDRIKGILEKIPI